MDNKPVVTIIDDTIENLKVLSVILSGQGFKVNTYLKGAAALQEIERKTPDIILLDILMPEMNGYEICNKLKQNEKTSSIPVIFISGLNDTTSKIEAFTHGGVDYVTKPFKDLEVVSRIRTHLDIHRMRRELVESNNRLEEIVAERTAELSHANKRLLEVNKLKNDFFNMINHELRTPANGIMGIGEVLTARLGDSKEDRTLLEFFKKSSTRLFDLIEDATMIMDMENMVIRGCSGLPVSELCSTMSSVYPDTQVDIQINCRDDLMISEASNPLMLRACKSVISLAKCFNTSSGRLDVAVSRIDRHLEIVFALDNLDLEKEQLNEFFNLETVVRASSHAHILSLAPVVAHRIIEFFGGSLNISGGEENSGKLSVHLPLIL